MSNKIKTMMLASVACLAVAQTTAAQEVAVKTNLLYDVTTTINLGVEFGLSDKWTLDVSGNYNPWTFSEGKKIKHWLVQPEARYWFCNKMQGHFLGVHLLGGQYNLYGIAPNIKFLGTDFGKIKDTRYEGWFAGAGVAYGYAWTLGKHWNLEGEIGVGYAYTKKKECPTCGEKQDKGGHHYVGPTKAAINLVYVF